ncbi:Paralysed flagella protein PflA [hydrothermal vent metagenome]|uniref:Paralysed flagella protein PflA n=1 Tax=hydrothermal vent metagenome TaxID=652676 RepID=A0A1W1D4L6_9ZZZZ
MFQILFFIILSFLPLTSFALEINIESAKENFQYYSILHLKDKNNFLCQAKQNNFNETVKIICAFSKKPSKKLKKIQNDFFEIDTKIKANGFFLIIKPYYKMKLFPVIFDMVVESDVYHVNETLAKHWMIVGYKNTIPYIKNEQVKEDGINFPFTMKKDMFPYVGGLDLKGNPVYIKQAQDVVDYIKIKQYYKENKYEKCLSLINDVLVNYPDTLFRAELLYYQIKVYSKLEDYDRVIKFAKIYLREFSSDENIAEVLALIANAYAKNGLNIDADYFFDRLFTEHQDSEYCKWGYIYKGDMLNNSGAISKAVKFYKKAYYESKTLLVAATAAFRLAQYYMNDAKYKDAILYIKKILKAKPDFFFEHFKESMDLISSLVEHEDYVVASDIAKVLLAKMKKDDAYEKLLKNRAIWLSKSHQKKEALEALNRYLKEFPDGTYEEEVQIAKDALFFDTTDENVSQRLAHYDKLIEDYAQSTIGQRALYEKAKLLLQEGRFDDVLSMKNDLLQLNKDEFDDVEDIIKNAATFATQKNLKEKKCHKALTLYYDYKITLSSQWDDSLYMCSMKEGDFTLAKKVIQPYLTSKEIEKRELWFYRYIKVDFMIGKYKEVIKASKDLITLIEDEKHSSKYLDVYRYLFDAYDRLGMEDKLLKSIEDIQRVFGIQSQDIERYVSVIHLGEDRKDDNIIIKYGKIAMKIQEKTQTYVESPYIEFTLYQAYMNKENYNEALQVILSLDKRTLLANQRARAKYLLGFVYSKLWRDEEAKKAYDEAIKADPNSSWAKLAKSAKEL